MQKMPTIFERDWDGDRSRVINEINPEAQWVFDGVGVATRKLDGTSCAVLDGKFYKRREVKKGKPEPIDFMLSSSDEKTGKKTGWVPVTDDDKWHMEAWNSAGGSVPDGTYELVGPKVQSNPEGAGAHILVSHAWAERFPDAPIDFDGLQSWLSGKDIEGLVWHHPDGRMAKIKLRDFGLTRPNPAILGAAIDPRSPDADYPAELYAKHNITKMERAS